MSNTSPLESVEQKTLFQWARLAARTHPELNLLLAVPNGGSRDPREARHLKEQGVKPGVPDLVLPVPRGGFAALWIELKRRKGGRVSEEQRAWIHALNRAGNRAVVCAGWDAAREEILCYLGAEE